MKLSDEDRRLLQQELLFLRGQQTAPDPMAPELPSFPENPRYSTGTDVLSRDVTQAFGGDPTKIDLSQGIGGWGRAGMGAMADAPQNESVAALQKMYPGSQVAPVGRDNFAVQEAPGGPVRLANPPGFESGDLAEAATRYGPQVLGSIAGTAAGAAATAGSGPFAVAVAPPVAAGTAVAATRYGREALQKALGTSRETWGDVTQQAAVEGGMELLPLAGAPVKAVYNRMLGRTGSELGKMLNGATAGDLDSLIQTLKDAGEIDLPKLKVFQKSDNPLVSRVAAQYIQMSPKAKERLLTQLTQIGEAARTSGPQVPGSVDELTQGALGKRYQEILGDLAPPVRPVEGGMSMGAGVQQALLAQKELMGQEYKGLYKYLDDNPKRFNLGRAQEHAANRVIPGELSEEEVQRQIKSLVMPDGSVDLAGLTTFVNVAKPNEKLSRINRVLQVLGPEQDFRVVKELRTQVGQLRDLPLAKRLEGGVDQGQIKQVYGDLSDAMERPLDGDTAFSALVKKTNRVAKGYYDNYDNTQVLQVLGAVEGKTPGVLFNQFAKSPDNLTPELLSLLDQSAKPSTVGLVKGNLDSAIMRTPDPYATIQQWERQSPDALDWLYPGKAAKQTAAQNAMKLRDLNAGPYKEAADAAVTQVGFAQKALEHFAKREPGRAGLIGPRASRFQGLINDMGGADSEGHRALRSAVFARVMDKSSKEHVSGAYSINPKVLAEQIRGLRDNGYWTGLLTERDRRVMDTLEKVARRTWKSGDAGTGLTIAGQIGRARHGDPGALANIWSSQFFADMLTRESINPMDLIRFTPRAEGHGTLTRSGTGKVLDALGGAFAPVVRKPVVRQTILAPWMNEQVRQNQTEGAAQAPPQIPTALVPQR